MARLLSFPRGRLRLWFPISEVGGKCRDPIEVHDIDQLMRTTPLLRVREDFGIDVGTHPPSLLV